MGTHTAYFPFCGSGAGALGFLRAHVHLLDEGHGFRSLGGIDVDPLACEDFETLTESPALCADVAELTPEDVRRHAGPRRPDVVFSSPPCKGFSALLPKKRRGLPKYQKLNRLVLDWVELMLAAWDEPPPLFLLENVPRIQTVGAEFLEAVRGKLAAAGYVFAEGHHDCGELGGLAQRRRRYLLLARRPEACPPLVYQPPKRRVRGVGEVLEELPMPEDPAGGPMHKLPRISWLNWVRLALIPAGGDWRDLPGVLDEGEARRSKHRRHRVEKWDAPASTVAGSGSNAAGNVADPRVQLRPEKPGLYRNKFIVVPWDKPGRTVTGASRPGSGAPTVADPRLVPAGREGRNPDRAYRILRWDESASTIATKTSPGCGAYSVGDIRVEKAWRGIYGVMSWEDAAATVTGNARVDCGRFAVADPRTPDSPEFVVEDVTKAPKGGFPVIVAEDGTWHRPLTTLELAALQGFPVMKGGEPLVLAGSGSTSWRARIGNAVPPPAARRIAEALLVALAEGDAGVFSLSASDVWVDREMEVTWLRD